MAIFSISDPCATSASPEITRAGGPAGISIMLNQRIGSSPRSFVCFARPYINEILTAGQATNRTKKMIVMALRRMRLESPLAPFLATIRSKVTPSLHPTRKICRVENSSPILRTLCVSHAWRYPPFSSRKKNTRCGAGTSPNKAPRSVQPIATPAKGSLKGAMSSSLTRDGKKEISHFVHEQTRTPTARFAFCARSGSSEVVSVKRSSSH